MSCHAASRHIRLPARVAGFRPAAVREVRAIRESTSGIEKVNGDGWVGGMIIIRSWYGTGDHQCLLQVVRALDRDTHVQPASCTSCTTPKPWIIIPNAQRTLIFALVSD